MAELPANPSSMAAETGQLGFSQSVTERRELQETPDESEQSSTVEPNSSTVNGSTGETEDGVLRNHNGESDSGSQAAGDPEPA